MSADKESVKDVFSPWLKKGDWWKLPFHFNFDEVGTGVSFIVPISSSNKYLSDGFNKKSDRGEIMEKPQLIYQKNADKILNRVALPKKFIEKFGHKYYMEVYENKIVLIPVRKDK